jgi:hypothetical protein
MEFFRDSVAALEDYETSIVVAAWKKVDESLKTPEPWSVWILILMRPPGIRRQIFTVGKGDVDGIEADNEVFGSVYLLKSSDDSRLRSDLPSEALRKSSSSVYTFRYPQICMANLVRSTVTLNHPFARDDGKAFFLNRRWVVSLVAKAA